MAQTEIQVMLKDRRTGKLNPCLFTAVETAISMGIYELADPEAYRVLVESRRGVQQAGRVLRSEPLNNVEVADGPLLTPTADDYADDPTPGSLVGGSQLQVQVANDDSDEPRMVRLNI